MQYYIGMMNQFQFQGESASENDKFFYNSENQLLFFMKYFFVISI